MMKPLRLLGLVLALALAAGGALAQTGTFALTILHTNDVHSRLQPINRFDVNCSAQELAQRQCVGGSARLAARIRAIRAELQAAGRSLLVLDAGDQFQGSLFYTQYKGDAEADVMNLIGYQAMAIGNHEFDDGPPALLRFVRRVRFPVITANVDFSREAELAQIVRPFTVLETGGRRIGVIGLTAEDTPVTSSPGPTVAFRRAEDVLPPLIAQLRGQGINTIFVLSHLGLARDREVAARIDGVTAIIGGHSHTLLSNTVQGAAGAYPQLARNPAGAQVPIVQAAAFGRYLGRLELTIDANGRATQWGGDVQLLAAELPEAEDVGQLVARLAEPLEALRARPVGDLANEVDQTRCRQQECQMGNLVADALLWRLRGQNVQIAFQNGGGLRASLPAGRINLGQVLTVLPFQNTVATFRLRGRDVVAALENGVSQVERNGGRFAQVAGLRYTWERARPPGGRIVSVEVRRPDGSWGPIEPDTVYTAATNDFVRKGGDGFDMFANNAIDAYDFGEPLEDAVVAYIQAHQPVRVELDGRITTR
jgi:5'-nucleotidase